MKKILKNLLLTIFIIFLVFIAFYIKFEPRIDKFRDWNYSPQGEIISAEGEVLACMSAKYSIYLDPYTDIWRLKNDSIKSLLPTLCDSLETISEQNSTAWVEYITYEYLDNNRFIKLTNKNIDEKLLERFKHFPIINMGKKAGVKIVKNIQRAYPFSFCAKSIIGNSSYYNSTGIEAAYSEAILNQDTYTDIYYLNLRSPFYEYPTYNSFDYWCKDNLNDIFYKTIGHIYLYRKDAKTVKSNKFHITLNISEQQKIYNQLLGLLNQHKFDWGSAISIEPNGAVCSVLNLGLIGNSYIDWHNYALNDVFEVSEFFKNLLPALDSVKNNQEAKKILASNGLLQTMQMPFKGLRQPSVEVNQNSFKIKCSSFMYLLQLQNINLGKTIQPFFVEGLENKHEIQKTVSKEVIEQWQKIKAENTVNYNGEKYIVLSGLHNADEHLYPGQKMQSYLVFKAENPDKMLLVMFCLSKNKKHNNVHHTQLIKCL